MGPSCRRRTRSTRKSSSRRRTLFKKHLQNSKNHENPPVSPVINPPIIDPDSLKIDGGSNDLEDIDMSYNNNSACSTPKAERFRIPEIKTCPPAPKKRRIVTSCSLQRTPIAFFTPPDLDLFFYFALPGVQV